MNKDFSGKLEDMDQLRHRVDMATTFGWSVVSGVTAMVWREKGEAALNAVWRALMSAEQRGRFLEALDKLGIRNGPPAVTAAKYHYFSNTIGGLNLHYVEESPRKVWIRYLPPWGTFPGISALAVPPSVRRTILSTWHPRNGELLGCPRLGWVATKFVSEGHQYDEGYFYEYDHDLAPDETFRVEHVDNSPEFFPERAPKLDPEAWPAARILKGSANYAADYVRHAMEVIVTQFGMAAACNMIRSAMQLLAVQYVSSLKTLAGVEGCRPADIAAVYADVLRSFKNTPTIREISTDGVQISFDGFMPFPYPGSPLMRQAVFSFFEMGVRVLNGRISIRQEFDLGRGIETWTLSDEKKWLW